MQIFITAKLLYMFRTPSRPSSGAQRASSNVTKLNSVTFEETCSPGSMTCTRGCNYSFTYSWWWARWRSETCRV